MIKIEKAQAADLDSIQKLYIQLFSLMAKFQPSNYKEAEQNREFLKEIISKGSFGVLVAKDEEQVVGFIIVQEQSTPPYTCLVQHKFAYIIDLVVDEQQRGRGLGKSLLDAAEHWAKNKGLDYLELGVLEENAPAKDLYLKEGYTVATNIMRKIL